MQDRSWKHLYPVRPPPIPIGCIARFDGTGLRLVAKEMRGVHIESLDHTSGAELDHGGIVPRVALPAAFPAVHPLAPVGVLVRDEDGFAGLDQVLLLGEEVIGTPKDLAPETLGGEVDEVGEGGGVGLSLHFSW